MYYVHAFTVICRCVLLLTDSFVLSFSRLLKISMVFLCPLLRGLSPLVLHVSVALVA